MMDFLNRLLSEENRISSMRLMAILSLLTGSGIAFTCIFKGIPLSDASPTIGIFVGAAFGGKAWQKQIETNGAKNGKKA